MPCPHAHTTNCHTPLTNKTLGLSQALFVEPNRCDWKHLDRASFGR
jgi:hypothetical protein